MNHSGVSKHMFLSIDLTFRLLYTRVHLSHLYFLMFTAQWNTQWNGKAWIFKSLKDETLETCFGD